MKLDEAKLAQAQVLHALEDRYWAFLGNCTVCGGNDSYMGLPEHFPVHAKFNKTATYCLEQQAKVSGPFVSSFADQIKSLGLPIADGNVDFSALPSEVLLLASGGRRRVATSSAKGSRAARTGAARSRQSRKTPASSAETKCPVR